MEDNEKVKALMKEYEAIQYTTGLRIKRVKEFQMIKKIHKRTVQEYDRDVPDQFILEPQNKISLQFAICCIQRLSFSS